MTETDTAPADVLRFDSPINGSELRAALPKDASIESAVTTVNLPDGTPYTASLILDPTIDEQDNLNLLEKFVLSDLGDYAKTAREDNDPNADAIENAQSQVATGGVQISAAAVVPGSDGTEAVLASVDDRISDAQSPEGGSCANEIAETPSSDVQDGAAGSSGSASMADAFSAADAAEDADEMEPSNDGVSIGGTSLAASSADDVANATTYTPRSVGVLTQNNGVSVVAHKRGDPSERVVFPMRRAAMSWKWCSSCVSYWDRVDDVPVPWRPGSDHPLVSDRFGFEMQLDINVERRQNVWAYPLWGTAQPPRGHGYTNSGLVFPRIWSATFPYAYADDYEDDSVFGNGATYSLTIGSAHRPYAGQKMRWSQWLVPGPDAHDRVRPSFQPLRFEINNNDANSFYCGHYKRPSACFFTYAEAPTYNNYVRSDNGASTLVTPNRPPADHPSAKPRRVVFVRKGIYRRLLSGGGGSGTQNPLSMCVDDASINLAAANFNRIRQIYFDLEYAFNDHLTLPPNQTMSTMTLPEIKDFVHDQISDTGLNLTLVPDTDDIDMRSADNPVGFENALFWPDERYWWQWGDSTSYEIWVTLAPGVRVHFDVSALQFSDDNGGGPSSTSFGDSGYHGSGEFEFGSFKNGESQSDSHNHDWDVGETLDRYFTDPESFAGDPSSACTTYPPT